MDIATVAHNLLNFVEKSTLPNKHDEYGKDHLNWMLNKLIINDITGSQAHRWIGWVQGCLCMDGVATLEEMKKINYEA